ncbi:MAG TPA: TIGR03620 family F420-dependent LLM class oxidoreductase [Candidatus Binataceae bacterium]
MDLRRLGVFAITESMAGSQISGFARKVEKLGYSVLWFPEAFGRDPFALAAHILTSTDRLVVGTGIANVWKREAVTMIGAARTLAELFPDRFILGIGVSHAPMMAQLGIKYAKPLTYMRDYLAAIRSAPYTAPRPKADPPIVIAALMPKMVQLAASETNGTFPVYITPEQTARMRAAIGPEKWICVQQVAMLETDPSKARRAARTIIAFYLGLPNYLQSLRSLGFDDADFGAGGSDRLVDAMIAWGDESRLRERIAAHHKAGATHVCVTLVKSEGSARERAMPDERALEALAPG